MTKSTSNLKKIKKNMLMFVLTFFIVSTFIFSFFTPIFAVSGLSSYVPSIPSGGSSGYVDWEYTYSMYTENVGSSWMFDWGDTTFSDWIELGESDTSVSQNYSWNSPGLYEVKIKRDDPLQGESSWSDPLIVNISIHPDLDGDGWTNEIEESYKTSATDPNEYPLDTDNDGTPDDSSPDGKYIGDANDDGDGLDDAVEEKLNSNPTKIDVVDVTIGGITHYFVDTDGSGQIDIFYNSVSGNSAILGTSDDGSYLIDVDADGQWDYTFHFMNGLSPYVEEVSFEFPLFFAVITIVLVVLIVVFILFKTNILYVYEEEIEKEDEEEK